MRVADYIFAFVHNMGSRDVFAVSGGGNMHLIDALGRNKNLRLWCNHHEQACAMAAEGWARFIGRTGVLLVTTGPGGTNALSAVVGSWLDSIPVLVISGQVKLSDTIITNPGLRQFGDQEINIADMARPVTKYAVTVTDKNDIRYHLEKAAWLAREGRPGPVWLDVPLNIQAADVDISSLKGFTPEPPPETAGLNDAVTAVRAELKKAKAPLLVLGNGIRLAGAVDEAATLVERLNVPFVTSILGKDLFAWDHPLNAGTPGIAGQRGANIVTQNCDFMLVIGSRMMLRQVGFNFEKFAPNARMAMVDIDEGELNKKSVRAGLKLRADAGVFIKALLAQTGPAAAPAMHMDWPAYCRRMRDLYNGADRWHHEQDKKRVNSYLFCELLGDRLAADVPVITSNGTAYISPLQVFRQKAGQRLIYNKACAAMGYGLPAAIGACAAKNGPVVCLENDGSLQMNIQELQTVVHHKLPVKMVVFNNDGYLSIKITQKNFFPDNICASTPESGVSCPDLAKIAAAYGIPFARLEGEGPAAEAIDSLMAEKGPAILEVMMDPWQMMYPKVSSEKLPDGTMVSKPIDDMYPFLSREEYNAAKFNQIKGESNEKY